MFFIIRRRISTCIGYVVRTHSSFVPEHEPCTARELDRLEKFFRDCSTGLVVLTGAGISTESGIPDYRSEGVGLYARRGNTTGPIQMKNFMANEEMRRRYWARNFVGWRRFSSFEPNDAHRSLSRLQRAHGKVLLLVTQNVDGLHQKAGSSDVLELHGTAYQVICLKCDYSVNRHQLQKDMLATNPLITRGLSDIGIRPDGDVDLPPELIEAFQSPTCPSCGGMLKPDIVFFGENVPRHRVDRVNEELRKCHGLLIVGSSMQVYSGYRFALEAHELGKPIVIVNIGKTRADHLATMRFGGKCGTILSQVIN